MNRGYFLIAFGKEYILEASNLVNTLRKFDKTTPVSLLCSEIDLDLANSTNLFDKTIVYNFQNELSINDKTKFERFGGTPKITMTDYSPYDETIYTDSDVLVQSNPTFLWEYFKNLNQPYIVTGGKVHKNDILSKTFASKINKNPEELYQVHSGLVYFNKKNKKFLDFIKKLKFYWNNYYEEGLGISIFRDGKADEHAIFATINDLGYGEVVNPTIIPTMTHNYHDDIELPSNIVTGGSRYNILARLDYPPPFIHMFRDGGVNHYETLYKRLINM